MSLPRPDLANADVPRRPAARRQPTVGMVSLGCPKALVDSERILTRLRAEGYGISPDYDGADAVIVNTCGFLDSARMESLEAIGEALAANGRVIVTGCLGAEPDVIAGAHPTVLAITGPHQYERVLDAVHAAVPPAPDPFVDLLPAPAVSLTPRHYSYLKISEGCNHRCRFCIIPDLRGRLVSRPAHAVVREAERLVDAGVRELLVISQDTSAYGLDRRHAEERGHRAHITDLARDLGRLGAWVRLHYVYPYPHVRDLVPLMAEGLVLPYLDVPFQHAHPDTLRRMARPAAAERTLDEIAAWRAACPDITLRSTFIVGYPGETEDEFRTLLDWLEAAQLVDQRPQAHARLRIQARGGLIQEQDLGAMDQRPGDHQAPPIATGEPVWLEISEGCQAEALQQGLDTAVQIRDARPEIAGGNAQIPAHTEIAIEGVILGTDADGTLGRADLPSEITTLEADTAGIRPQKAVEHAQGGGLAGPVGPQDADDLPLVDGEGDAFEDGVRPRRRS